MSNIVPKPKTEWGTVVCDLVKSRSEDNKLSLSGNVVVKDDISAPKVSADNIVVAEIEEKEEGKGITTKNNLNAPTIVVNKVTSNSEKIDFDKKCQMTSATITDFESDTIKISSIQSKQENVPVNMQSIKVTKIGLGDNITLDSSGEITSSEGVNLKVNDELIATQTYVSDVDTKLVGMISTTDSKVIKNKEDTDTKIETMKTDFETNYDKLSIYEKEYPAPVENIEIDLSEVQSQKNREHTVLLTSSNNVYSGYFKIFTDGKGVRTCLNNMQTGDGDYSVGFDKDNKKLKIKFVPMESSYSSKTNADEGSGNVKVIMY